MDALPDLETRRKRALFRAWHRGMKEMDLILGRFADTKLAAMAEGELAQFEAILSHPDIDLYHWVSGRAPIPAALDNALLREICRSAGAVQER